MKEQYSKVKDARDEALKIHSAHLAEATHRAAPQIHSLARTIGGHCLPTGMQEIMLGDDDCNFRRLSSTAQIRQNSKIYDIFSLTPSAMFVFDCIDDSARKYNNLFSKIPRRHLELQLLYLSQHSRNQLNTAKSMVAKYNTSLSSLTIYQGKVKEVQGTASI